MGERVREIDSDEGQRLLRIVRRGTGSVVTWRPGVPIQLGAGPGETLFYRWRGRVR